MRNVPVGGGCRRNKRSKGSSSKSPASSSDLQTGTPGSSSTLPSNTPNPDMIGHTNQIPPLRLMAPLHQYPDFAEMGMNYGLNYSGMSAAMVGGGDLNFQIGSSLGRLSSGSSFLSAADGMDQQWRLQAQQFPFMSGAGLDPQLQQQQGIFEGGVEALGYHHHHVRPKPSTSGVTRQLASVKMEENQVQELNLSRQFLGINNNNNNPAEVDHHHHQYWSGGNTSASAWTDLSGFSSSSATSNPQ